MDAPAEPPAGAIRPLDFDKGHVKPFEEKSVRGVFFFTGIFTIVALFFIIFFLVKDALPFVTTESLWAFFTGTNWNPEAQPPPAEYGALPIILGTILVTIGSIIFAVPLGLGCAIYIAEIAPPRLRTVLKTGTELLAGIPSVVYGFFGLTVLTGWIRVGFDQPMGESWLAASILLGVMALPTIISVAEDAISAVPREYKEASLAMGATRWQTISKVVVPSAISGITAAVILGMGRAIGETMAVMMVAGNTTTIPDPLWDIFATLRTATATLGIETREVPFGSTWYHALFVVAVTLFLITLAVNSAANYVLRKMNEKFHPKSKEEKDAQVAGKAAKKAKKKIQKKLQREPEKGTPSPPRKRRAGDEKAVPTPAPVSKEVSGLVSAASLSPVLPVLASREKISLWRRGFKAVKRPLVYGVLLFLLFLITFAFTSSLVVTFVVLGIVALLLYGLRVASPHAVQRVGLTLMTACCGIVLVFLGILIGSIFVNGVGGISFTFLTDVVRRSGREGGILPCIVGTLWLVLGTIAIAIPLGVGAGIYLAEYASENRVTKAIRAAIDNLNGTPSIIFGLFGFAFFVNTLNMGFSLLAGQLTMALMILPTIIRTTEEAMKTVPMELREASYAMGASKWETIRKVVLPSAKPGIVTGAILGMGRAAGETAPIMYVAVAFYQRFNPLPNPLNTVQALPYHLYVLSTEVPGASVQAGATALVLLILVILFFALATYLRSKYEKELKGA